MKRCPECNLMLKRRAGAWVCPDHGEQTIKKQAPAVTTMDDREFHERVVVEGEESQHSPTMEMRCPECGNEKAYFYQLQTRSSDEPPTTFLTCTKCKHKWREY